MRTFKNPKRPDLFPRKTIFINCGKKVDLHDMHRYHTIAIYVVGGGKITMSILITIPNKALYSVFRVGRPFRGVVETALANMGFEYSVEDTKTCCVFHVYATMSDLDRVLSLTEIL